MAKTFELNIVTPEKQVLTDTVEFVAAPAEKGELGILPGHTHLVSRLVPGELRFQKGQEVAFFAVAGGFIEVHPDKVLVFAEAAETAAEIDTARAQASAERAKAALRDPGSSSVDLEKAQAALRRALIRLRISETYRVKRKP